MEVEESPEKSSSLEGSSFRAWPYLSHPGPLPVARLLHLTLHCWQYSPRHAGSSRQALQDGPPLWEHWQHHASLREVPRRCRGLQQQSNNYKLQIQFH